MITERLLYISEKRVEQFKQDKDVLEQAISLKSTDIDSMKIIIDELNHKLNATQQELQYKIKELEIQDSQMPILYERIKGLQSYIEQMSDLKQMRPLNRNALIQELNNKSTEMTRLGDENLKLRSQVATLEVENNQLKNLIKDQKDEAQNQTQNLYTQLVEALKQRDTLISQLKIKLEQTQTTEVKSIEEFRSNVELESSSDDEQNPNDNNLIQILKKQLIDSQTEIIQLRNQVNELQKRNLVQITQEQITANLTPILRNKIIQLNHLQGLYPLILDRVAQLEQQIDEANIKISQLQELRKNYNQLQTDNQKQIKYLQNLEEEHKFILQQSKKLIQQNHNLKNEMLKNYNNEYISRIQDQGVDFQDGPFDSLESLINSYYQIRSSILRQARQQYKYL
ncbi:hypothetical protein pb186bvf_001994 [Paramecium bursaria]